MKPLKIEPLAHRAALAGVPLFPQQRRSDEIAGQYGQVFQLKGGPLKSSRSLGSSLDSSNCDIPGTLPEYSHGRNLIARDPNRLGSRPLSSTSHGEEERQLSL
jgi:hypothetical protein